jgi:hypothetical protein
LYVTHFIAMAAFLPPSGLYARNGGSREPPTS